jgi:hypothetical protein
MQAHRFRTKIPSSRAVTLQLPSDFPPGEAEVIVLAGAAAPGKSPQERIRDLTAWIASLPPSAPVPIESLDRGEIYR